MVATVNNAMVRAFNRMLEPVRRRLRMVVQRAVVEYVHAQNGRPFVQVVSTGGEPCDAELVQPFGLSSQPVAGAGAIVLNLNGDRSHAVAINVGDNRYRVEVSEGEVALYNQDGAVIHLRAGRIIDVDADQMNINCDLVINGNTSITGDVDTTGTMTNNGIPVGSTLRVSGVTPGSGTSGTPVP